MWTVVSLSAVQTVVCAISFAPVVLIWQGWLLLPGTGRLARAALISVAVLPSYVLFATCLIVVSPLALRLVRWQTPPDSEMRIADMDWALLRWVRYGASIHLARMLAGSMFRGTPLWTFHLRLHGARLGKGVYINSLSLSDYNLLECGDGVVIGGDVHLSGHTVEAGIVKTGRVRIGSHVTIGLGSVIEIGVEVGDHAQIGALSFVPKRVQLEGGHVYAGAPVRRLERMDAHRG